MAAPAAPFDQREGVIWYDGKLVPWSDATLHVLSHGLHYARAFENPKVIRAAIDRNHVRPEAAVAGAREIAFFPPMTGG